MPTTVIDDADAGDAYVDDAVHSAHYTSRPRVSATGVVTTSPRRK
jgi:hypothetical protein